MAKQLLCDRPHHVVIGESDEYMPLVVRQPEGGTKEIDLCMACWNDFQGFMHGGNAVAQPAQAAQVVEATPVETAPAAPAEQPQQTTTAADKVEQQ